MEKLDLSKGNLRKFGLTMGIAFLLLGLFILIRHKNAPFFIFGLSGVFFASAFIVPGILKPAYIFWMRLAHILGFINTRIILIIMFYLIITPIGLALKLFRVDLLDRKIEKNRQSYWRRKEKDGFSPVNYERQF